LRLTRGGLMRLKQLKIPPNRYTEQQKQLLLLSQNQSDMKRLIGYGLLMIVVSSCSIFKKTTVQQTAIWLERPSSNSDKIRVATSLSTDDLKRACIDQILKLRLTIDTTGSSNLMKTAMKRYEHDYVRFFISFQDSIAIIKGEAGNLGLNGTWSGEQPNEHNIYWKPIIYHQKGWELMDILSDLPQTKRQFNGMK